MQVYLIVTSPTNIITNAYKIFKTIRGAFLMLLGVDSRFQTPPHINTPYTPTHTHPHVHPHTPFYVSYPYGVLSFVIYVLRDKINKNKDTKNLEYTLYIFLKIVLSLRNHALNTFKNSIKVSNMKEAERDHATGLIPTPYHNTPYQANSKQGTQ